MAWDRYAYVLNSPIRFTDLSGHWPESFDTALGAGYQLINDLAWNIPNAVFGTDWQDGESAAFQSGQEMGRATSTSIGLVTTVDGIKNVLTGLASLIPTTGVGAACTIATGGSCAVVAGPIVGIEATVVGAGAIEAGYGSLILKSNVDNPVQGPRFNARNFRKNLLNRTPKPQGMKAAQAHHVLPQALEDTFNKLGINVHDPKWGAWVEGGTHQSWTRSYQDAWVQWLGDNPYATIEQVEAQASTLAEMYGYIWK